ncbi:PQQ-binding-like beta-propeller repeat protein [Imperialibacter roseus]|uniref:PQQ-binding-like beta-propeller repeat protein n=1 Tax=Imperialibacter roseus TaxID=1324217 RepID=A0ABZ0IT75_9BACT|nr:PQQ-binding-like beta-propeller repeat protein [Imperialibacter roseus]WOK07165.1 PQQ-binding-like beta-propeller repeat protein [Imperialibacter roseus]
MTTPRSFASCFALFILVSFLFSSCEKASGDYSGWPAYAGSKMGERYSSNDQINKQNVSKLREAWRYSTGDKDPKNRSQIQCNPIIVDGVLYGTSAESKLFALDAATGAERWVFDPFKETREQLTEDRFWFAVNRGVMYWADEAGNDSRIYYSIAENLYAVNTETGQLVKSFGKGGHIDLREQLDTDLDISKTYASGTTPGVIFNDLIIMGMRLSEGPDALPGHIRAFDVRTGERKWIFHTIPHPGEKGYDTWEDPDAWKKIGGANDWSGMSLDEERGIVFVSTGTANPDFYGGFRKGENLFANCVIALDAGTGKYIWHYQVVHHDLWDRDLATNPILTTVNHEGKMVDAVAQITKHGYVFLLERETGDPIFPIEEVPVPTFALDGEAPWPTQPVPTLPEPFARQSFTETDVYGTTPEAYAYLLEKFKTVKYSEAFTPPSKEGSWIFPGYDGGGEWGGASVDPESGILYVNSSEMPWALHMVEAPASSTGGYSLKGIGQGVYNKYCMSCHGPERKGNGAAYPSLIDLNQRYNKAQLSTLISTGKNMMPAFKQIPDGEQEALMAFVLDLEDKEAVPEVDGNKIHARTPEIPFRMTGYNRFIDENGYPGIKPPWGTLNAVDLNTGKLLWKKTLGELKELTEKGISATGTENYGGPVSTKGGLVFIAATKDEKIRAFDKVSGEVLWEADLPASGFATPAVYMVDGKQYVVIACGGGKIGAKSGDEYVAFALPE